MGKGWDLGSDFIGVAFIVLVGGVRVGAMGRDGVVAFGVVRGVPLGIDLCLEGVVAT